MLCMHVGKGENRCYTNVLCKKIFLHDIFLSKLTLFPLAKCKIKQFSLYFLFFAFAKWFYGEVSSVSHLVPSHPIPLLLVFYYLQITIKYLVIPSFISHMPPKIHLTHCLLA